MMAPEFNSRPPEQIDRETLEAVRQALTAMLRDGDGADSLRPALRAIATEARTKTIPPEQLLVTLKEVWYALPDMGAANAEEKTRQLQRIVTMCIREYYA